MFSSSNHPVVEGREKYLGDMVFRPRRSRLVCEAPSCNKAKVNRGFQVCM